VSKINARDDVIWAKHVKGSPEMVQFFNGMVQGELVALNIDGIEGYWRKMNNGKDGRPTYGLRPDGDTKAFWQSIYHSQKGEMVPIAMIGLPVQA
jgi:hypothetical protein